MCTDRAGSLYPLEILASPVLHPWSCSRHSRANSGPAISKMRSLRGFRSFKASFVEFTTACASNFVTSPSLKEKPSREVLKRGSHNYHKAILLLRYSDTGNGDSRSGLGCVMPLNDRGMGSDAWPHRVNEGACTIPSDAPSGSIGSSKWKQRPLYGKRTILELNESTYFRPGFKSRGT